MFDTPQEAALKVENARLRAENEYLRRAVEAPGIDVRPYAVEETMIMRDIPPELRLPNVAGVRGTLARDEKWHVIAHHDRPVGDRLEVAYYMPSQRLQRVDDETFANHILPKMHEQFIRTLARSMFGPRS